jgi:hypothetical protein
LEFTDMADIESLHSASLRNFQVINGDALGIVDPILIAIGDLRAGQADYNENAPMDTDAAANAYAEISYMPPQRIIEGWNQPALTKGGAIEALKLAMQADQDGDYAIVGPMLAAALAYIETTEP